MQNLFTISLVSGQIILTSFSALNLLRHDMAEKCFFHVFSEYAIFNKLKFFVTGLVIRPLLCPLYFLKSVTGSHVPVSAVVSSILGLLACLDAAGSRTSFGRLNGKTTSLNNYYLNSIIKYLICISNFLCLDAWSVLCRSGLNFPFINHIKTRPAKLPTTQ